MKSNLCPASSFHTYFPGSFLWNLSVWISCLAGQGVPAGLATAICSQTEQRAAEFSLVKWSTNGVFLLCSAVDFLKACRSRYLWNISSAKLVRIRLWVWNYWIESGRLRSFLPHFWRKLNWKLFCLNVFSYPLGYWQTEKQFIVLMRSRDSLTLLLK